MTAMNASSSLLASLETLSAAASTAADDAIAALEAAPWERVARWRLACGDGEDAARWRLWSLCPPGADELARALAALWRSLGELERAERLLPAAAGWERLALALSAGRLDEAEALQQQLLTEPPPVAAERLLELAAAWQRAERPAPALVLLLDFAHFQARRGGPINPQLANALAQQLEQLEHDAEAAHWWCHSLSLDPAQVWPLMRMAHHEWRRGRPAVTEHYCREALRLDPGHRWAPGLRRQALEALGAWGSLALLEQRPLPRCWQRRQEHWRAQLPEDLRDQEDGEALLLSGPVAQVPAEATQQQSELGLWGERSGLCLAAWALALRRQHPKAPVTVWVLASPDPQLVLHNLSLLLAEAAGLVRLRPWPQWDGALHGSIGCLLLAHRSERRAAAPAGVAARIWRERAAPHRWEAAT